MNETRTSSMLQRVPMILAVTAASYGLQVPTQALRWSSTPSTSAVHVQRTEDMGQRVTMPMPLLPRPA
jgi:hypothetical protein